MRLMRGSIYTRLLALLLAFVLAVPWSAVATAAESAGSVQEEAADASENNSAVNAGSQNDVGEGITENGGVADSSAVQESAAKSGAVKGNASASDGEPEIPVSGKGEENAGNVFSAADVTELAASSAKTVFVRFYSSKKNYEDNKSVQNFDDIQVGKLLSELTDQFNDLEAPNGWTVIEDVPLGDFTLKYGRKINEENGVDARNTFLTESPKFPNNKHRFSVYPTEESSKMVKVRLYKDRERKYLIKEFNDVLEGTDFLDLIKELGDDYKDTDWYYSLESETNMARGYTAGTSYKITKNMDACIGIRVSFYWNDPDKVKEPGNLLTTDGRVDYGIMLSEQMKNSKLENGSGKGLDQANWSYRTKSGKPGTVKASELSAFPIEESIELWPDLGESDGTFSVAFFKENPATLSMEKAGAALDNLIYLFANQRTDAFSKWTKELSAKVSDKYARAAWCDADGVIETDRQINGSLNVWYGMHTVRFYWKNPATNGTEPYNQMATREVPHGDKLWENVIYGPHGVAWSKKNLEERDWHVDSLSGESKGILNKASTNDIVVTEDLTVWVDSGFWIRVFNDIDYPSSFEISEVDGMIEASSGDSVSRKITDWLDTQPETFNLKKAIFVTGSGADAADVHDVTDVDVVDDSDVIVWVKTFDVSIYEKDPSVEGNPQEPLMTYPGTKSYNTVGDVLGKFFKDHPEYKKLSWNKPLDTLIHEDMKLWTEDVVALSYEGSPEKDYGSLQEALESVPGDAKNVVVRLLKDLEVLEDVDCADRIFTLNLDGHQLKMGQNELTVESGSEITVEKGNFAGNITAYGGLVIADTASADLGTFYVKEGAEVLLNAPVSVKKLCLDKGCFLNAGSGFELTGSGTELQVKSGEDVGELNSGKKLTLIRPQKGAELSERIDAAAEKITLTAAKLSKEVVAVRDDETGELVAIRVAEKIYVSGSGDDGANSGFEPDQPVKTFKKAKELLEQSIRISENPDRIEGIYVTGTVKVTGTETWSLPKNTKLMRYEQGKSRAAEEVSTFAGSLVSVTGALTLQDIIIDGKSVVNVEGALVEAVNGGSLTIARGAVLQNNLHRKMSSGRYFASGGAVYADHGTVTMTGGEITNNESWYGGGVCLNGSTFTMTGGSIYKNWAAADGILNQDTGGGGIAAECGSTVNLKGGTVRNNRSRDVGGGISIGLRQEFTVKEISQLIMEGGEVSGNTSDDTGGGIYIQSHCVGRISAGSIINNRSDKPEKGFAGGGIYVNGTRESELTGVTYDAGALYLTNVKITGNRAAVGGGVAGCDTSTTNIYRDDGAVIYGNEGEEVYIDNGSFFTQRRGTISEFGLGNTLCNWTDGGQPIASESDNHADRKCLKEICRTVNLESTPDNTDVAASVIISGNTASNGFGGGIATNGYLQIGEPGGTSVTAKKLWDDAKNADKLRPEGIDDVKVWLLRDGKRVGYYNFSKNNDGTWPESLTIDNLPEGNYTVEEELPGGIVYHADGTVENPDKADVVYEASFEKDGGAFVVKNRLKRDLAISKTVSGYMPEALKGASYSFNVKLSLADGAKVEAELFSGKEEQGKKVTASVSGGMLKIGGSTGIKLKSGERLLLKSLPADTRYEVSETDIPAGVTSSVKVTEILPDGGISGKPDPAGNSAASGTIGKAGSTAEIAFTNTYDAAGTWTPSGTKTLTGRDMAAGEFRFTVKEAEKTVSEGVNAAAGNGQAAVIGFTEITYTLADVGTHTYVIAEELTGMPERVTGDSRTYTVRVEVSDQGDGTLKADAVYTDGTKEAALAEFKNVYEEKREITVTFDKVSAQTGASLAGAVLRVVAADGTEIETWTSDGKPHQITGKLTPDVAYRLIEVSAPAGYQVAADITFEATDGGHVAMKDEEQPFVPNPGTVAVTKNLVLNGNPMGAEDQTFYVALYEDAACTKRVSDIRPVVFKKTSSSTVEFTGLPVGKVYYVGESDANGGVLLTGTVADGTVFAANFQNGNTAATRAGRTTRVTFANEFHELPHGFYREGELTVTKKLLTADGSPQKSDEVFYAGIFADREYSVLSDQVSENIVALELGGKSKVSVTVPVALTEGQVQKLYVTETDENGVPVEDSDFAYEVTVQGGSVSMDTESPKASVTITNQELPEETETETETETEKQTEKKKEAVKTGDDTPVAVYISLMAAALIVLLLLVFRRGRKK